MYGGKNFFFFFRIVCITCSILSDSVTSKDCSLPGSSLHGILQAKMNTGVGCHSLLQGICLTQELNPDLLPCRQILYPRSQIAV